MGKIYESIAAKALVKAHRVQAQVLYVGLILLSIQ